MLSQATIPDLNRINPANHRVDSFGFLNPKMDDFIVNTFAVSREVGKTQRQSAVSIAAKPLMYMDEIIPGAGSEPSF